jgi:hypothetical protein
VVGELDLHRALHEALRQLRKQATRADDLLLPVGAGEQLVEHPVREKLPSPGPVDHPPREVYQDRARWHFAALALRARSAKRQRQPRPASAPASL